MIFILKSITVFVLLRMYDCGLLCFLGTWLFVLLGNATVVALFRNIAVFVKLRSMVVWFFYILQENVHVLTCRYEFCSILICFPV